MEFGLNSMEIFFFCWQLGFHLSLKIIFVKEKLWIFDICFYYLSDLNNTAQIGDPYGHQIIVIPNLSKKSNRSLCFGHIFQ